MILDLESTKSNRDFQVKLTKHAMETEFIWRWKRILPANDGLPMPLSPPCTRNHLASKVITSPRATITPQYTNTSQHKDI